MVDYENIFSHALDRKVCLNFQKKNSDTHVSITNPFPNQSEASALPVACVSAKLNQ